MRTGRSSGEDEGRNLGDASINRRTSKNPANHQKLGKRHVTNFLLQGTNPTDTCS